MLGQYLPAFRPVPVVALTATATSVVQADILSQLGMEKPARFIHGFRRNNLAIEVAEVPMPDRPTAICNLLADPRRRPAIVYATSRKMAEKLAEELSLRIPAAAYHAGLDPERRERVQTAFLAGELEVVVATIAFGMGIDKADIRTVIHAGLPATVEGYYQEIGRAGRDGKPSRTYLMHSYADHRMHNFFLTRDYPAASLLDRIFNALQEEPRSIEELREVAKLGEEEFDKALEKLEIHGGARVDFGGNVTRGARDWKKTYTIQAQFRAEQFAKVLQYTESSECRMASLVRHFGDVEDAAQACNVCDVCDPAGAVLRQFRRANAVERAMVQQIVDELRPVDYKATGTLQRSIDPGGHLSREEFDSLLDAMMRASLIGIEDAEYEKDGEIRRFRKVRLAPRGLDLRSTTSVELLLSDGLVGEFAAKGAVRSRKTKLSSASSRPAGSASTAKRPSSTSEREDGPVVRLSAEGERVVARLKEWRTTEAKRLRVPAYLILNDRTINALAQARPKNPNQLLGVDGIGPGKAEKFGDVLLELCI
jgi:superfamily II DNA helicase RecQ